MKVALFLKKLGFSSTLMHSLGVASIGGAVSLWGRSAAKSDKEARARAERLAVFIGLAADILPSRQGLARPRSHTRRAGRAGAHRGCRLAKTREQAGPLAMARSLSHAISGLPPEHPSDAARDAGSAFQRLVFAGTDRASRGAAIPTEAEGLREQPPSRVRAPLPLAQPPRSSGFASRDFEQERVCCGQREASRRAAARGGATRPPTSSRRFGHQQQRVAV